MNKTALCIQMLHLLRAKNDIVTMEELAKLLETNVRNVREYKKELELAGYTIATKRGMHGGYRLMEDNLVPSVSLSEKELRAIGLAVQILEHRPEFLYYPQFLSACGKFLNSAYGKQPVHYLYQSGMVAKATPTLYDMVETIQSAVKHRKAIEFTYASLSGERVAKQVEVHPYDIVNNNGAFYVVAYALSHKQFRNYKISVERMKDVVLKSDSFVRDQSYRIQDHIGKKSIFKGMDQTITLEIYGPVAVYIAESEVGVNSESYWENDILHLTTTFESEKSCDGFVLSLGTDARVIAPESIKLRIRDKITQMYEAVMA